MFFRVLAQVVLVNPKKIKMAQSRGRKRKEEAVEISTRNTKRKRSVESSEAVKKKNEKSFYKSVEDECRKSPKNNKKGGRIKILRWTKTEQYKGKE